MNVREVDKRTGDVPPVLLIFGLGRLGLIVRATRALFEADHRSNQRRALEHMVEELDRALAAEKLDEVHVGGSGLHDLAVAGSLERADELGLDRAKALGVGC